MALYICEAALDTYLAGHLRYQGTSEYRAKDPLGLAPSHTSRELAISDIQRWQGGGRIIGWLRPKEMWMEGACLYSEGGVTWLYRGECLHAWTLDKYPLEVQKEAWRRAEADPYVPPACQPAPVGQPHHALDAYLESHFRPRTRQMAREALHSPSLKILGWLKPAEGPWSGACVYLNTDDDGLPRVYPGGARVSTLGVDIWREVWSRVGLHPEPETCE